MIGNVLLSAKVRQNINLEQLLVQVHSCLSTSPVVVDVFIILALKY